MKSKGRSLWSHAANALDCRYGITMTEQIHDKFVKDIQTGNATLLQSQTNRVKVWLVKHNQTDVVIVYDKERKQIVTALPPECRDPMKIGLF